jgi:cell wall-associated NlpC family hydrolase
MAWRHLGRLVPRDAADQEAAALAIASPSYGDLVTYGVEETTHVAFWLHSGRILHSVSGRGVVDEPEPPELAEIRRGFVRLRPNSFEVPRSS